MRYFSPTTRSFFDSAIHGKPGVAGSRMPSDARPISDADHARLMEAQSKGQEIGERNGVPVAVDRQVDVAERTAVRRRRRNRLLADSDWTQGADSPLDEATRRAWASYRQQLRDLDMTVDDLAWPVRPGEKRENDNG